MKDILGKNQKIVDIEALRGIGLLLVVSYPFFERFLQLFIPGHEPSHFLGMDQWGLAGVAIFLLISGYFMVPAYSIDSMSYLKKRIGRLFPLYFISICIIFLVTHIWPFPRTVTFTQFMLNIPLLNGFIGMPYVDEVHWYLTALVSGILVFSCIIQLPGKYRHVAYWGWLAILLGLHYLNPSLNYLHLLKNGLYGLIGGNSAPVLIIGASLADIHGQSRDILGYITLPVALGTKFVLETFSPAQLMVISGAVVLLVVSLHHLCIIFRMKWLIGLGTISYLVYLIHQNIWFRNTTFLYR